MRSVRDSTPETASVLRAVIYTRVSQDKYGASRSTDEQEAECRDLCRRNGWVVVEVICDNDRSASQYAKRAREGYPRLVRMVEAHEVDVVVMWEGSRGQRDLATFVEIRDLCAKQGVLYSYSGKVYDMSRTDDRFSTGIDALVAERYAGETHDRIMRNVAANAVAGRPHGRLPYGFARSYDIRGKFIEQYIVEEQAKVIRRMAEMVLVDNLSCRQIAIKLNKEGIPSPGGKLWSLMEVRRILINPGYAGKRVYQGRVIGEAIWPGILSDEIHAALVARLSDPRRKTVKDGSVKHFLTGAARCGAPDGDGYCDALMRRLNNKARGNPVYMCSKSFHVAINQGTLDEFVEHLAIERLSRDDAAEFFLPRPEGDSDTAAAQAEVIMLNDRLTTFALQAAAGRLSAPTLAKIEAELAPQIAAAERRARPRIPAPVLYNLIHAPNVAACWKGLTIAERREVVQRIMTLHVKPVGRGKRIFDPRRVAAVFRT